MTGGCRYCVVMPTYNNAGTAAAVAGAVLSCGWPLIVVCDGCTDGTPETLEPLSGRICIVSYPDTRGKGHALMCGFRKAASLGYTHAVTIDADGQHDPHEIGDMAAFSRLRPRDIIVGSRCLRADNMPSGNTFANRFSNFWFTVHTLRRLPDTQSGFRVYPLYVPEKVRPLTSGYETELELLVRSAWSGIGTSPFPISVMYAEERVSHFRPGRDFLRISLLNTVLTFAALLYGYPSMLVHRMAGLAARRRK